MELLKRFSAWLQQHCADGYEFKLSSSLILSLSHHECRPSTVKCALFDFHDMKGGLSSILRRGFDETACRFQRLRFDNSVYDERPQNTEGVCAEEQGCMLSVIDESVQETDCVRFTIQEQEESRWATMQPELLTYIMHKVDECRSTWPSRRDIFACASVCRSWREATKEAVRCPELTGRLSFPISVKQPGPRESLIQCLFKRDRSASAFYLYLSSSTTLTESGKFLLAARRIKRATSCEHIISLDASGDLSQQGGEACVGKLRSNFLGTKFTIHDRVPTESGKAVSIFRSGGKRPEPKQSAHQSILGTTEVAHFSYELNVLNNVRPRWMHCTLHSIPASCIECGRSAQSKDPSISFLRSQSSQEPQNELRSNTSRGPSCSDISGPSTRNSGCEPADDTGGGDAPLILTSKLPHWHDRLKCWCLNFRGRVTVASVKNFQLIAAAAEASRDSDVLLQFGKVGEDLFTMDYKYPLSALQAFAICLSSFGTKGKAGGSAC